MVQQDSGLARCVEYIELFYYSFLEERECFYIWKMLMFDRKFCCIRFWTKAFSKCSWECSLSTIPLLILTTLDLIGKFHFYLEVYTHSTKVSFIKKWTWSMVAKKINWFSLHLFITKKKVQFWLLWTIVYGQWPLVTILSHITL